MNEPKQIFDVNFFLRYFDSIPEHRWCIHSFDNGNGAFCALGHCGVRNVTDGTFVMGTMASRLVALFESHGLSVTDINDWQRNTRAATPKLRILEALYEIQAKQAPPKPAPVVQHGCAHLWMFGLCAYCCTAQPATVREVV